MEQGVAEGLGTATTDAGVEPRNAPLRSCRIEHISWRFHRLEDVLITAERVHRELGILPRTSRLQGGGWGIGDITIDYNDPDGNRVELLTQFASKAQILFGLDRLFKNPPKDMSYSDVYQSFNMEKMIAMFRGGEAIDNLRPKKWVKEKAEQGLL